MGLQGKNSPVHLHSAPLPIPGARLHYTYMWEQLYQPQSLGEIQPGISCSPEGKPGTKALCSLIASCPAPLCYASFSNSGIKANGTGKASVCKCSDQGETCGLALRRLPRKTGLSRQKGLRGDASSHQISQRNNNSFGQVLTANRWKGMMFTEREAMQ